MVVALRQARHVAAEIALKGDSVVAAWDGHPAASDAWVRAAAYYYPRQRWAVLGAPSEPLALLAARPSVGSVMLHPVGHHHGGFQPRAGADLLNVAKALTEAVHRRVGYLPFCTTELTEAAQSVGTHFLIRTHDATPIVEAGDPEQYSSTQPRKLRATIRQAGQALRAHSVEIGIMRSGDLSKHYNNIAAIESAGHRKVGHPLSGRRGAFVRLALTELDNDGLLEVWIGRTKDETLGYLVTCRGTMNTYFYTMGIRRDAASLSLGTAIFHRAINSALSQGMWVNLGPGNTLFKRRFATAQRTLYDLLPMSPRTAPLARRLLQALPSTRHGGPWQ